MSVYRDMALDAGYSGEEADQMAQMLEREAYDDYQRHLGELAAIDARNQAIGEAINLLVSEGLGKKVWWCADDQYAESEENETCLVHIAGDLPCGWRLLIPLPDESLKHSDQVGDIGGRSSTTDVTEPSKVRGRSSIPLSDSEGVAE